MRVTPSRNFFLIPENYANCKSTLVHRFGELTRKIWHARNLKGQVSSHEFLQAVMKASNKKFRIGAQSDPVEFMSWLLNTLQKDLRNNPADELVATLISNRTAHKSSSFTDNPGLGCIALQYIKAYQGQCSDVDDKKPADADFAQTFAPNCGVQVTTLAPITGRLLGCQSKYVSASKAFSSFLIHDQKSLDILYNKNHTKVGAAVSGSDGGSPYLWCILFSSGKPNSRFVLDGGLAKVQGPWVLQWN